MTEVPFADPIALAPGSTTAQAAVSITIVESVSAIEPEWRALEKRATISAYQRFEFVDAWMRHAAKGAEIEPSIGLVRDETGRLAMILPFGLRRRNGIVSCHYLGGSHVNINMPLVDPAFARKLDAGGMRRLLAEFCRKAGVDLLALAFQPEVWIGALHPFLGLPRQPSSDDVMRLDVDKDLSALFGTKSRLRRKQKRLLDAGARFEHAKTPVEVEEYVAAFLVLKARQLRAMGVANPFAAPGIGAFMASAAIAALSSGDGLHFSAILVDSDIVAVRAALTHRGQVSLMVQSFDATHPLSKYSAGEVLFAHVLAEWVASGLVQLDFGVGDARFKQSWANARTPMFDVTLAFTSRGRLAALVTHTRTQAIRAIKANKRLYAAIKSGRARLARIGWTD
jgi:CelD/BcsL family acetyltransferase involved in cellulose biosynthesis